MTKTSYRLISFLLIAVICISLGFVSWLSFRKVGGVYLEEMALSIQEVRQEFLKDTVDNVIREIDVIRELEVDQYVRTIDRRYETLSFEDRLSEEEFVIYFTSRFRGNQDEEIGLDYWTVLLWNNESGEILYDPSAVYQGDLSSTLVYLTDKLIYFRTIDHGAISGLWGVSTSYVDSEAKRKIAEKIRSLEYKEESYVWVNEILDYAGGPNYAIRVVHPNLPETEGMYLSTDIIDVQGNTPYLTELEGIKEHGELFFRYWFKRLNNDEIVEKITYAKLYEDFNWVVAKGIHIDDLERYIAQASSEREKMAFLLSLRLVCVLVILIIFSLFGIMLLERIYFKKTATELQEKINIDSLTSAYSRRCGIKMLEQEYATFEKGEKNSAIMVIDLDDFKLVNDTYGHETGDLVLKKIVRVMQKTIRTSDYVIRWGGDEFVVVVRNLSAQELPEFVQRLTDAVANLAIPTGGDVVNPTISIGVSYFEPEDVGYADALRRADRAMYDAKKSGCNRAGL